MVTRDSIVDEVGLRQVLTSADPNHFNEVPLHDIMLGRGGDNYLLDIMFVTTVQVLLDGDVTPVEVDGSGVCARFMDLPAC